MLSTFYPVPMSTLLFIYKFGVKTSAFSLALLAHWLSPYTHTHTHTHTQPPASGLNCHPPPTPLTWASIILSLLCFYEFQHEQFPYNHFTLLNHSTVIRSNENKNGITWPQLNTSVIVFQSFLSCHIFLPTPIKLSFFNWAMIFLTPHYPNVALLA